MLGLGRHRHADIDDWDCREGSFTNKGLARWAGPWAVEQRRLRGIPFGPWRESPTNCARRRSGGLTFGPSPASPAPSPWSSPAASEVHWGNAGLLRAGSAWPPTWQRMGTKISWRKSSAMNWPMWPFADFTGAGSAPTDRSGKAWYQRRGSSPGPGSNGKRAGSRHGPKPPEPDGNIVAPYVRPCEWLAAR